MTDLNQSAGLAALAQARLSAELLEVRAQLTGGKLSPLDQVKASTRALELRALLGAKPALAPVVTVTGTELGEFPDTAEGKKELRAAVKAHLEGLRGQMVDCPALGGQVEIRQRGIKESLAFSGNPKKLKLLHAIPQIIKAATVAERSENHKRDKKPDVAAYFYLNSAVKLADEQIALAVVIEQDSQGHLYYDLLVDPPQKKAMLDSTGRSPDNYSGHPLESDRIAFTSQRAPDHNSGHRLDSSVSHAVEGVMLDDTGAQLVLNLFLDKDEPEEGESPAPGADPLQVELEAARADVDQYKPLIDRGALTKPAMAALDRYSAAYSAVEAGKVAAAWEAGKARPIGTANNKPHTIKAADALTPAGAIKADSSNSKADSALWYYQGDIQRLAFTASVTIEGQAAAGAEQAKATLAGVKAAQGRGFKLRSLRAGRLGTVWVLEAPSGDYLTRAGFEDGTNPVFDRPAMPEAVPGYESMLAQQTVLATAFIAWLDTLPAEQRHNQGVVSRKIGSTAVGSWVRMEKDIGGLFLQYKTPGVHTGIRITGSDFDALIEACRRLANAPEIEPEAAPAPTLTGDESIGRAPAGGTVGMNGEFYKGGTILPNTTLPKGSSTSGSAGTGRQLVEPGVLEEPAVSGARSLYAQVKEFVKIGAGGIEPDSSRAVAMVHYLGENAAALVLAYCKAYNGGKRWILPGEVVEAEAAAENAGQPPAEPAPALDIVEYTTRRGKVLRGAIRTDLSLDQAKAIDPYTWKMNGGYFIREKHLGGDTGHIEAAPAPVVMSAEQQAEALATSQRQAEERARLALASQVEKLRQVANSAIEKAESILSADRKTNTVKRAREAGYAIDNAEANKAAAKTLNRVADAIEAGSGGVLTKLSSRAQLDELQRIMRRAMSDADEKLGGMASAARRGRPFEDNDLKYLAYPRPWAWSNRFARAAKTMAEKAPKGNSRLIAALAKLGEGPERINLDAAAIALTRKGAAVLKAAKDNWDLADPVESIARADRLARMGITDHASLVAAVQDLIPHLVEKAQEDPVKKAERAIIGQKVGIDFFPTPAHVAQRMAKLAKIREGTRVLEPSAGNGNLADAAKAEGGQVDVIEISGQLRDILTAKGYTVVDHDFTGFKPEQPYGAILMNPPFSNRQDAAHIMQAFGMLAGGGTLVAIAGEGVFFGKDQKATAFRDWLDENGADVEPLEGGTFKDDALLAQTGANARLIVLRK